MSIEDKPLNQTKTLAERLGEGRLPVAEALKYAMQLADSLRKLHDKGQTHGAVTPSSIVLTAEGASFVPAPEGSAGTITPYTAPEVTQGRAADERSDIFSFGAVLFEMLSGQRAFDGESRVTLSTNLTTAPTPSSGSPLVDRLVGPCLSKNPDARSPKMQRVIMELKLLTVAARRADMDSAKAPRRDSAVDLGAVREEMQRLEARLAARFQVHEQSVSEMQRSASQAVGSLREQMAAISGELAISRQQAGERAASEQAKAASDAALLSRIDRGFDALDARIAQNERTVEELRGHTSQFERTVEELRGHSSQNERTVEELRGHTSQIERTVEELRGHTSQFERNIAADLVDLEQSLKVQSAAIESARTAMSQTDDLVERVVEALESLQMAVMEQGEGGEHSTSVVN